MTSCLCLSMTSLLQAFQAPHSPHLRPIMVTARRRWQKRKDDVCRETSAVYDRQESSNLCGTENGFRLFSEVSLVVASCKYEV